MARCQWALRIKRKGKKWVADATTTLPDVEPESSEIVMGVDTGIKVPAVAYIAGQSARFYGNGREMRYRRRKFYARRKKLQRGSKRKSVKRTKNKESRWMKDANHKISRKIVNYAHQEGVGTIKVESLDGIREGTTRTSRGAKARKNNRSLNSWTFYQLTQFIIYKAARLGIKVEMVDPAHTSQECPACKHRSIADDRAFMSAVSVGGRDTETSWEQSTSVAGLALMVIVKVPREPELLDSWKVAWDRLIWKALISKAKATERELNRNPPAFIMRGRSQTGPFAYQPFRFSTHLLG